MNPSLQSLFVLLSLAILSLSSCKSPTLLSRAESKKLQTLMQSAEDGTNSQSGWVLRDAQTGAILFSRNGNKFFTPASNTKILSLALAENLLGDSLPVFTYFYKKDTLFFRGTGDPTFLHPSFSSFQKGFQFLKNHQGPLVFEYSNFKDNAYGKGWMWDDFPYAFQAEKAPLPLYGNVVHFKKDSLEEMEVFPPYFDDFVIKEENRESITRLQNGNLFFAPRQFSDTISVEKSIPFRWSPVLIQQLLEDTLQKPIRLQHESLPDSLFRFTYYSTPKDTVFSLLMQESDNHIAEQLILMCAEKKFGYQNAEKILNWAVDSFFQQLPQAIQWADGSGISRYNLLTPETGSLLVFRLWQQLGEERFKSIFPAGGVSGTIKSFYQASNPYVYAKTGTLRYVHNLSGIVYNSSGKPLVFSFMHNNFPGGSILIKREMERVLERIRDGRWEMKDGR
jgi:D-alanyl-D-alanine carboxypeptidase/D-alanyl-D-alanine-endopeptidase (penicillin-binding protein 4)